MKAIVEAWWVMAFVLFWVVVLPVAGLVEIGILFVGQNRQDNDAQGEFARLKQ